MADIVLKLSKAGTDYYLLWSTVVDAPIITNGLTLDEFKKFYKERYGTEGLKNLEVLLKRVNETGTSSYIYKSADDLIRLNRAGVNEKRLSKAQIIKEYINVKPRRKKIE
jgi:hypothetical protein